MYRSKATQANGLRLHTSLYCTKQTVIALICNVGHGYALPLPFTHLIHPICKKFNAVLHLSVILITAGSNAAGAEHNMQS